MSQSPTAGNTNSAESYFRNWDTLGLMIARGSSFSGRERNCVFLNLGATRFADVSSALNLDFLDDGRSVAYTDWDHDGDLDLWLANRTAPGLRLVRNDLAAPSRTLAIRLEGRHCNRDAIGARVEVQLDGNPPRRLTETLRAGDGFLTQSTKWLHFGMLDGEAIARVRVRWPGSGRWEAFSGSGLQPGQRYRIVQGESQPAVETSLVSERNLEYRASQLPESPSQFRAVLSRPPRVPPLEHLSFDGSTVATAAGYDGPVLLNFWASWCEPCVNELRAFAEHRADIEQAGVRIVALSVDGLQGSAPEVRAAEKILKAIAFPFDGGLASMELMQLMSKLKSDAFYKERPFPLPSSFLLDRQRRWAVLYTGPVSVSQLLADAKLLDGPELASQAFPFPGRFVYRGGAVNPLAIAAAYREGGYLEDARRELQEALVGAHEAEQVDAAAVGSDTKIDLYRELATVETQAGNAAAAVAAWQHAVRLDPDAISLRTGLAIAYFRNGEKEKTETELDYLASNFSRDVATQRAAGRTWWQLGRPEKAAKHLAAANGLAPNDAGIRYELALALQLSGDTAAAIDHYQGLLKQAARDRHAAAAANNLAWIYATHPEQKYRNGEAAVKLARQACRLSEQQNPTHLGTLGSAYAEAGQFQEAIRTSQIALSLAERLNSSDELLSSLRHRLALYAQGKPFHESHQAGVTSERR